MRFSKRGIVTNGVSTAYDEFKQRLRAERSGLAMLELGSHHGFALAVREGLRWAQDAGCTHALVCQHDRRFVRQLSASTLGALLDHFETRPSCRYVGFPSGTSKRLAARTANEYKLGALLEARSHALPPPPHGDSRLSLRPSIFWYDSNHLVHVDRALELLYTPDAVASAEAPRSAGFDRAPPALRARLGDRGAARFRLRRGDFIEERFGVEQRNLLAGMADDALDAQLEAFDHFGSYLLEEVVEGDEGVTWVVDRGGPPRGERHVMVDHIVLDFHVLRPRRGAPSERRQGAAREEKRRERARRKEGGERARDLCVRVVENATEHFTPRRCDALRARTDTRHVLLRRIGRTKLDERDPRHRPCATRASNARPSSCRSPNERKPAT